MIDKVKLNSRLIKVLIHDTKCFKAAHKTVPSTWKIHLQDRRKIEKIKKNYKSSFYNIQCYSQQIISSVYGQFPCTEN